MSIRFQKKIEDLHLFSSLEDLHLRSTEDLNKIFIEDHSKIFKKFRPDLRDIFKKYLF